MDAASMAPSRHMHKQQLPSGSRQHSKRKEPEAISQAQAAETFSDAVTSAAIQHIDAAGHPSLQTPPLAACGASSQSLSRKPLLDKGYSEADAAATPQQAQSSPPTTSWQQTLSAAAPEPGQSTALSAAVIHRQCPPDNKRAAKPGRARRKPVGQSTQAAKKARRQAPAVHRPGWQLVPAEAFTPEELGGSLLALGVLPQRVCSYGCQAGQWVVDDTIIAILAAVCCEKASSLTHAGQSYELVTCYLNSLDMTVDIPNKDLTTPPEQPQCILVVHTSAQGTGQHISSLVINPAQQLVHAFDSLGGRWADARMQAVVQGLYPNLDLFGQHGYRLSNNTGKIRQTGATCGPWALWCLVAYMFNYKQCRHQSSDEVDCAV